MRWLEVVAYHITQAAEARPTRGPAHPLAMCPSGQPASPAIRPDLPQPLRYPGGTAPLRQPAGG